MASDSGDEVALEWSRRQLEGFRNRVFNEDDIRKIDLATDRPDRVQSPDRRRLCRVARGLSADELETFVEKAIDGGDRQRLYRGFRPGPPGPRGAQDSLGAQGPLGPCRFPGRGLERPSGGSRPRPGRARPRPRRPRRKFAIARAEAEVALDGLEGPDREPARAGGQDSIKAGGSTRRGDWPHPPATGGDRRVDFEDVSGLEA